MVLRAAPTPRSCLLCNVKLLDVPVIRVRDMSLADAWGVLRQAAAMTAMMWFLIAIAWVVGIFGSQAWRANVPSVDDSTAVLGQTLFWLAAAVLAYFALPTLMTAVGG